jgi:uncharacterized phage protein (TIGR01671 family)
MREIKFRVKIKGDAGVYKVEAIDWLNLKMYVHRACGLEWVDFAKIQSLMQYTGLRDKHGKDIYEGDICVNHGQNYKGEIGIIEWGEFGFRVSREFKNQKRSWVEYWPDWFKNLNGTSCVAIIGNIYENSEIVWKGDD